MDTPQEGPVAQGDNPPFGAGCHGASGALLAESVTRVIECGHDCAGGGTSCCGFPTAPIITRFNSYFASEHAALIMAYEVWPICGDGLDMEVALTSTGAAPSTFLKCWLPHAKMGGSGFFLPAKPEDVCIARPCHCNVDGAGCPRVGVGQVKVETPRCSH